MTDEIVSQGVWIELIKQLPLIMTACGTLIAATVGLLTWLQSRKNTAGIVAVKTEVGAATTQVAELKKNTDGMQEVLLRITAEKNLAVGRAEGLKEGTQAGRDERRAEVAEAERVEDRTARVASETVLEQQPGDEPMPVVDDKVADLLTGGGGVTERLDHIQDTADALKKK